jgi:hypothetical protein
MTLQRLRVVFQSSPADRGFLTGSGVVRADAFVRNPGSHLMPVRALEHVPSGQRGRFLEIPPNSGIH